MDCDRQVLEHVLRMDLLSCSEIQDFEACMDWVRVKSKQDAVSREFDDMHLGNLFYEIRFASMTKQELCNLAAKYKSVLLGEISTIINIITLPGFHSENFNQQPRYTEWNESAAIKCNREIAGEKEYPAILTQSTEALFSTNVPLLLSNFTCVKIAVDKGSNVRDSKRDLAVDVEIIEVSSFNASNNLRNLCKMEAKLTSVDNKITLAHPILVRPGFFYKICISKFQMVWQLCAKFYSKNRSWIEMSTSYHISQLL